MSNITQICNVDLLYQEKEQILLVAKLEVIYVCARNLTSIF